MRWFDSAFVLMLACASAPAWAQEPDAPPGVEPARLRYVPNERRLFHPLARIAGAPLGVVAFDARGQEIELPFRREMSPAGVLADLNGDGSVECADRVWFQRECCKGETVLLVTTIAAPIEPLLAIAFDPAEWSFAIVDRDHDGHHVLELGPEREGSIERKVVFRWSVEERRYVGPEAGATDPFRVIDPHRIPGELARLRAERTPFLQPRTSHPSRNRARPWDQERGETQVPSDFWTAPPKALAVRLAEGNRTAYHREHFRLALDEWALPEPPATCTLELRQHDSPCAFGPGPNEFDLRYVLRCSNAGSELISEYSGWAPRRANDEPQRKRVVKRATLTSEEARQVAHTIYWLRCLRTRALRSSSYGSGWSTADSDGLVMLHGPDGAQIFADGGGIWGHDGVPTRWDGPFDGEVFVTLSFHLLSTTLEERIKDRWRAVEQHVAPPPH